MAAFRAARAAFKRVPRLHRLALVWAPLALVAAAVVGFYLPTQVPGTMWEGLFRAILYVAAGAIVLVVLPVLLAGVIPRRRGGNPP